MIGGNVDWVAMRQVGGSPVRRMASRAARGHLCAEHGPIGFFSATPTDRLESAADVWVVGDTDLTNAEELRERVGGAPVPEAIIARLYRREGPGFLRRLRGAFALGLWDARERMLLLAVDRFGIKRLHYTSDGERVAFASRASALLAAPGVERRLDPTAVYTYLNFGYVPAPGSIFGDIARLEPGQVLLLRPGRSSLDRYWDLGDGGPAVDAVTAPAHAYRLTEDAVRTALGDARPKETGVVLSGSDASSPIAGLMARITGETVNAFSIGFADEDESLSNAELTARHFGANHYTHVVTADEALALLPRVVAAYDEPFGDPTVVGTLRCAELASECGVTQLLAGDGADAIFGDAARRSVCPRPASSGRYQFFFADDGHDLLAADFRATIADAAPDHVLDAHTATAATVRHLDPLLYLDLKLAIGEQALFRMTRTAERAGVAVRFPLLDAPLVELMANLPLRSSTPGGHAAAVFARAFHQLLPHMPAADRAHRGEVPTGRWLRAHRTFREFARDVLLSPTAYQRGYFRPGALERLFALHEAAATPYSGDRLWTVLMLELWHRRHLDATDLRRVR